jgi:hypothetical protein
MSRLFSIHETAENEVNEAADFYDLENPGLGNGFLDDVERTIDAISLYPETAELLRGLSSQTSHCQHFRCPI